MKKFIDRIHKILNSLFFRVVIVAYATFIIYFFKNEINIFLYLILIFLYVGVYFILMRYKKPILRLLNDFIFIYLVSIGKNPNDIVVFMFILLPVINSINFSGKKKTILPYLLTIVSYIFCLCYFNKISSIEFMYRNLYPLIPLFFLWVINSYTTSRNRIKAFIEELNDAVDSFYLKEEDIKRPHLIYKGLINVINKNMSRSQVEEIVCFIVLKGDIEKLAIVNGSSFIWQFDFANKDIIKKMRLTEILVNEPLKLDNSEKKYNIGLYSKVDDYEYLFFLITNSPIPLMYIILRFFRSLSSSLSKISKVLLSEKKLQELKMTEIIKLSERSQYVNRANKTMHFMRNRLGPFSNLLTMLDDFDSIPPEKVEGFKELLINEKNRARIELLNISERANDMLEKANNPFVYDTLVKLSLERVFTVLKRNFASFFPAIELEVKMVSIHMKRYVLLNEEGFEIFLSDWLNNMYKYKKNIVGCEFLIEEDLLSIIFYNDHNQSSEDINKMILDLQSSERNEIMKRTTHGLYIIKSTLTDMDIPYKVHQNEIEKKLYLTLKLKLINPKNEDSNI